MTASNLEHNLKLIPYHQALASSMVYLPVFVLFTRDNFGVSGALQIASLTYLFIVALEVPSGWMSDRLGRVPTLSVAAAGFAIGQVCFLVGGEQFGVIVLGQFFVSSGYAFISGTDVSFHFDSLEALGRSDEYAQRQARISSLSYLVRAGTAIAGGVLGLIDLRLTFAVSLVIALAQLAVTRMLHEPGDGDVRAERFVSQIGKCLAYMRHGFMAWLFFYGIALVVLEHVAFTLMQPWLTEALGKSPDELGATPLVSGGLFAITAFVGAAAARASAPAGERFGTVATLIGLGVISAVIVTGMALSISLVILALCSFGACKGQQRRCLSQQRWRLERNRNIEPPCSASIRSLAGWRTERCFNCLRYSSTTTLGRSCRRHRSFHGFWSRSWLPLAPGLHIANSHDGPNRGLS